MSEASVCSQFKPNHTNGSRPKRGQARKQIIDLQERAYATAMDPETKPALAAGLMRSWCLLQEERRKLAMKPLPKPIDVTLKKHRIRESPQFTEPKVA